MKIGRFRDPAGHERLGVVLGAGGVARDQDQSQSPMYRVLDLQAAATARDGKGQAPFGSMDALMRGGLAALDAAREVCAWAGREAGAGSENHAPWFQPEASVRWDLPVVPRNVIAGGMNFARHRDEVIRMNGAGQSHSDFPMGFIKLAQSMVPTRSSVARPEGVQQFDYEIEVAAVIGRAARDVKEGDALDHVFGYTIMNDLSAREWQMREMANQSILLGKNFPGFGPLGPWILTADEVPDPSALEIELRVNGEVRQQSSCADLIFGFAEMVAHWSRMGLARGDIVTSGTPEGIAFAKRPDATSFYLKPGDSVEAEVRQIGTLETRIVAAGGH
ncbi:MAG: fumarylacetoacetate hydrolase family protein [Comamonadaceae bacterium]|nr:MAG: fumarylacetoacetate hydrolase family protein [Comamonadaceae bacterium]